MLRGINHTLARRTPHVEAAQAYLARLRESSRRPQWQALRLIAGKLWPECDPLLAPWDKLTTTAMTFVQAWLIKTYAPATARRAMAALRGVVRELWRLKAITAEQRDRLLDLAPVRGSRPPAGRALTSHEIRELYKHADRPEKAILAGLLWAGMRRSELASVSHSEWKDEMLRLTIRGKGDKVRYVWLYGHPAWHFYNGGMTAAGMWRALRRLAKKAGVPPFSPHDLRRTYASLCLGNGIDLATVQQAMGHADPRTTSRYDRRAEEAQIEAAKKLATVAGSVYTGG